MAWPPGINDDGTNTTGTILDAAYFNAIKAYIDLLDRRGTWTPADASGAGLALTIDRAVWARAGHVVTLTANVVWPGQANGAGAKLSGLPFANTEQFAGAIGYTTFGSADLRLLLDVANNLTFYNSSGAAITNAQLSAKAVLFTVTYRTDAA